LVRAVFGSRQPLKNPFGTPAVAGASVGHERARDARAARW